jgi:hypothetical protein
MEQLVAGQLPKYHSVMVVFWDENSTMFPVPPDNLINNEPPLPSENKNPGCEPAAADATPMRPDA